MFLSTSVRASEGFTLRCECIKKKHKKGNMSVLAFVIPVCVKVT